MAFAVEVDDSRSGCAVVNITGEIDLTSSSELWDLLVELPARGRREIVVNVDGVDFIDSTGLGLLVAARKRVRLEGGNMSLLCAKRETLLVLELTGLDEVFEIGSSLDDLTDG